MRVHKFGGSSIKDAASMKNVVDILTDYGNPPAVVVVSAIGKTTNLLELVVSNYFKKTGEAGHYFDTFKSNHTTLITELLGEAHSVLKTVNDLFVEIDWILEEDPKDSFDYVYDQIVSIGELVSSRIMHAYMNHRGLTTEWVDARDIIRTDETYRESRINWDKTVPAVKKAISLAHQNHDYVITQGFIGGTDDNNTTTLGREGSDYSAAILCFCLDAESQTIWKDVPGVLNADPRRFENAILLERLSYREAIEMTYYGASVIHPKTIQPLQRKNIPLLVRSFLNPGIIGTTISGDFDAKYPPMVMVEEDQTLLYITPNDYSFIVEHHLGFLFNLFASHRIFVNMMQNTALSFVACVPNDVDRLKGAIEALAKDYIITKDEGLQLITVRHFDETTLHELKEGRTVIIEERLSNTVQMVTKQFPKLKEK